MPSRSTMGVGSSGSRFGPSGTRYRAIQPVPSWVTQMGTLKRDSLPWRWPWLAVARIEAGH